MTVDEYQWRLSAGGDGFVPGHVIVAGSLPKRVAPGPTVGFAVTPVAVIEIV
jgi:DNA-binding transcriptional MocR family regulator